MDHGRRPTLLVVTLLVLTLLAGTRNSPVSPASLANDPPPTEKLPAPETRSLPVTPDAPLGGQVVAGPPPYCTNLLQDYSFEAYTPNPNWAEFSTNFGTPLCTAADCGTGGGTAAPRSGSAWVWFGGTPSAETAHVSQTVTIPTGTAVLEIYLWLGTTVGDAGDYFEAQIDGVPIVHVDATESAAWGGGGYHWLAIFVNSYADGGPHTIRFYATSSGETVNFNLDDVGLWHCPPANSIYLPLVARNFASAALGTPTLLSPADGSTLAKYLFDWTDVPGATGYGFQMSTSTSFIPLAVDTVMGTSEFEYVSTLAGNYYWRVYATGPSGSGPYSAYRSLILASYNADDDGDSLRNGWELHGYDYGSDGSIDVDLPGLGANYRHKDVFVEMDFMERPGYPLALRPSTGDIIDITAAFSDFPMSNPDGLPGVNIHLDLDDEVPYDADLNPVVTQFNALKAAWFPNSRQATHHYMIWANQYSGGTSSGLSMNIPASDFIVTLGGWPTVGGTPEQKVGTFIHELGHNLNLTHGGSDHVNYKPNYISIMNYWFQTWGLYHNGDSTWYHWEYQPFALPALNENSLSEPAGLGSSAATGYGTMHYCPGYSTWFTTNAAGPINWNCDGDTADTGQVVDVNGDLGTGTLAATSNNYSQILFNGGTIGSGLAPDALREFARRLAETMVPFTDELTWEMQQEIDQVLRQVTTTASTPPSDNR